MGPSELAVSRSGVSRRQVLRGAALTTLAGLTAACAPSAVAPPPAAAPPQGAPAVPSRPAWEQDWEKLVAAAKQEGKVSVITRPGASYRKFLQSFEEAFPGIVAEQQEMLAIQLAPRLLQERNGGIYNWDAMVSTSSTPLLVLRPAGALDPLRPALRRPDILQDNVWRDGFDGGWTDTAKSLAYAFGQTLLRTVWVNTDLVRPDEIKTARDLLDPKWKGRMVAGDPRTTAFSVPATSMRLAHGDDIVKKVYKDQETVLNKDYRVMTEALIKGKYAIGIQAVSEQLMRDMLAEGVGKNVRALDMPDCDALTAIGDVLFLLNRPPHPNATRVFLNWILTKEGQIAWIKATGDNSRRLDVPPGDPNVVPKPGRRYRVADVETSIPLEQQTIELANKVLD